MKWLIVATLFLSKISYASSEGNVFFGLGSTIGNGSVNIEDTNSITGKTTQTNSDFYFINLNLRLGYVKDNYKITMYFSPFERYFGKENSKSNTQQFKSEFLLNKKSDVVAVYMGPILQKTSIDSNDTSATTLGTSISIEWIFLSDYFLELGFTRVISNSSGSNGREEIIENGGTFSVSYCFGRC